jgi:hypothetical protein
MDKGTGNGTIISGGSGTSYARDNVYSANKSTGGDATSTEDFNPLWISEFKHTNAYDVWQRTTDPLLFDIVEPRHPCTDKPSVVADIGLRLQEGLQDLKLEQQLAPAREAIARTISTGSTNFFKTIEGVRGRWAAQAAASSEAAAAKRASTPAEATKKADESPPSTARPLLLARHSTIDPLSQASSPAPTPAAASPARPAISSWGVGIGSFLSNRASKFTLPTLGRRESVEMPPPIVTTPPATGGDSPHATAPSFLGMVSPAGISSPSVFPPTPLETAPPTAVPPPLKSPGLRSLSLLTPKAAQPPTPLPAVPQTVKEEEPIVHAIPAPAPAPKVESPVAIVHEEPVPMSPPHQLSTYDAMHQPEKPATPKHATHEDPDAEAETDADGFTSMAL